MSNLHRNGLPTSSRGEPLPDGGDKLLAVLSSTEPLDAWEIVWLTFRGLPPASALLLEGASSDLAWQEERGTVPRMHLRLWPVAAPEGVPPVYLASIVLIDAVTLRLSGRIPILAYDLWPAADETRDVKAAEKRRCPGPHAGSCGR